MPPKRKSAPKAESPVKPDPPAEPATRRTRGRPADVVDEPSKKVKKDPSPEPTPKSKTEPKKTKSNLSAKSKDPSPSPQKAKPAAKEAAKEPAKAEELKKVVLKGGAPVDQYFSQASSFRVFNENGVVYSATLNQANLQQNNNKFYILQVLQSEADPNRFIFFTRWGRVGVVGQQAEQFCPNSAVAIREFHSKKRSKINGGYKQVEMNYDDDGKDKEDDEKPEKKESKKDQPEEEVQSELPESVQSLVRLIFDMKMMNNAMKEIGYDAKKMPLGKLAKSSILKGYEALKGLMDEIKGKKRHDVINSLSGEFYSFIPHDFGFAKMHQFILDTEAKVKAKLEMLQSLEDIQVFTKLLDEGKISSDMNQLDSNYLKLNTTITPLDKKSDTYKLLVEYVDNTHAATHTAYRLSVDEIFEVKKDVEEARYRKDIPNKQLLWHGSRLTNFVGILSQGLRIAPPEAPVTGYMFGKGVYFADMVTKSANYCFTSRENNTGLMLLCEVALGGQNEKYYADYYANLLPEGKHSTKGCGKNAPGGGKHLGDVFVPCGQGVNTGLAHTSLLYNEFIVYDVAQIKCRYLFRMKFNYR